MLNFFKGIVDWISEKLNKNGVKNTVTAIILSCFVLVCFSRFEMSIINNFNNRDVEKTELNQKAFTHTKEFGFHTKRILRKYRNETNANYILYIDYHNGSENIAGYHFCKFGITMDVQSDTVPRLWLDNFKDEYIYTYDIFFEHDVQYNKVSRIYEMSEMYMIDKKFVHDLCPNKYSTYAVFCNLRYKNITSATLLFLFEDKENINYSKIINCATEIEREIRNTVAKSKEHKK